MIGTMSTVESDGGDNPSASVKKHHEEEKKDDEVAKVEMPTVSDSRRLSDAQGRKSVLRMRAQVRNDTATLRRVQRRHAAKLQRKIKARQARAQLMAACGKDPKVAAKITKARSKSAIAARKRMDALQIKSSQEKGKNNYKQRIMFELQQLKRELTPISRELPYKQLWLEFHKSTSRPQHFTLQQILPSVCVSHKTYFRRFARGLERHSVVAIELTDVAQIPQ